MAMVTYLTLFFGIGQLIWLYRISKKKANFFVMISILVILYCVTYCFYMTAYPNFWIFAMGQWFGVSIFYSLACYFTLAIDSFRIFPEYLTRSRIIVCFIVYYLPFVAVFAVLLYNHEKPDRDRLGCRDIPRLIYLIMALIVNAVFAVSFATIYFYAQDRVKMSKGYLLKHLLPIILIILCFTISYTINFFIYLYSYILSKYGDFPIKESASCSRVLKLTHGDSLAYIALLLQYFWLIPPVWCIYYYIWATHRKETRKQTESLTIREEVTTQDNEVNLRDTVYRDEVMISQDFLKVNKGKTYGFGITPNEFSYEDHDAESLLTRQ